MNVNTFVSREIQKNGDLYAYKNFEDSKTAVIFDLFFKDDNFFKKTQLNLALSTKTEANLLKYGLFNNKTQNKPLYLEVLNKNGLVFELGNNYHELPYDWKNAINEVFLKIKAKSELKFKEIRRELMQNTIPEAELIEKQKFFINQVSIMENINSIINNKSKVLKEIGVKKEFKLI